MPKPIITDTTTATDYGPWRVTTRTIRTVERVRARPGYRDVQPVFAFVDGRPVAKLPAVPGGGGKESCPLRNFRDGRLYDVHHAAALTRIPEWRLWAEWLAVIGPAADPTAMPALRPLKKRCRRVTA